MRAKGSVGCSVPNSLTRCSRPDAVFKHDYFLFFSNSQGICLSLWFTLSTLPLADKAGRARLETTLMALVTALVFVALLTGLAVQPTAAAQGLAGGLCSAAALVMYAAPLSTVLEVVRTRSSASLSWPLCVAATLNAAMWTTYGVAVKDPSILVPNIPGIASGALQVALILRFPAAKPGLSPPPESELLGAEEAEEAAVGRRDRALSPRRGKSVDRG